MKAVSVGSVGSCLLKLSPRPGEECIDVGPETGDTGEANSFSDVELLCLRGEGSRGDIGSSGAESLPSKYFAVSAC